MSNKIDECVFTESYLRRNPAMRAVAERHGKIENDLTPAAEKKPRKRARRKGK